MDNDSPELADNEEFYNPPPQTLVAMQEIEMFEVQELWKIWFAQAPGDPFCD